MIPQTFCIKNGLGFPISVFSYFDVATTWVNGVRYHSLPEGNIAPGRQLDSEAAITLENLPDPQEGIEWIVAKEIKEANPRRLDFVTMLSVVTDSNGDICGCLAFDGTA